MEDKQVILTRDELYTLFCLLSGNSGEQTNTQIKISILKRDFVTETTLNNALKDINNIYSKVVKLLQD